MTAPKWAKGYDLEWLKALAAPFKDQHRQYCNGAFGLVKENTIADALSRNEVCWTRLDGEIAAVCIAKRLKSASRQIDFAGRRISPQAGDVMISAIAGAEISRERLVQALLDREQPRAMWIEDFIEHPLSRQWDQFGRRVATKVMAASDLKGLWLIGAENGRLPPDLPASDAPALSILDPEFINDETRSAILSEIDAYSAEPWAQHYSSYNKRQSWTAFALRGYIADDPGFIIKPSEMSRKWQKENPALMRAACSDTIARSHFPTVDRLLTQIPGEPQRVRLMRLASGGGELTRHADITDPEAGTSDGQVARLHIPLISPPGCKFIGWSLDGERIEQRFPEGSLSYLDTRKPHSAINPGEIDRVHLVIDQFANAELRAMIEAAS